MKHQKEFKFIECCAKWRGKINATDIARQFNYSKGTAKRILQTYQFEHPEQFVYCSSNKTNIPTVNFNLFYSSGDLSELAKYQQNLFSLQPDQNQPHFAYVHSPQHFVEPALVANLLSAIEHNKRIEVNYISLRSTDYDGRIIAPHHIVYDGLRWHLRAFDEKHQAFLDFNLSRFQGAGELEETITQPPNVNDDTEWQTKIDVIIVPDPRLNPAQKQCIEREYQMQNGQLVIKCRAALVKYLLLRLRLDVYKNTAEAQQIMLEPNCQKQLLPYIPRN